jgi:hypothetical protein
MGDGGAIYHADPARSVGRLLSDGAPHTDLDMGEIHLLSSWRARRAASDDVPLDVPPFHLEEPCPGCGRTRTATMVWRRLEGDAFRTAMPRMEPHYLCREGEVVFQEILDAGIALQGWSGILGHFEEELPAV